MIEKEKWIKLIKEEIQEIADRDFQNRIWIKGQGPQDSSYVELMCRLFDDKHFDAFLKNSTTLELSKELLYKLLVLKEKLEKYQGKKKESQIVNDPQWIKITVIAKEALKIM